MKKRFAMASIFIVAMLAAMGARAATYTTYTDYVAFLAASPAGAIAENFEDPTLLPGFSITEVGGTGTIAYGVYKNIVDDDPLRTQAYSYAPGMYGFGGFFDLYNPGGPGKSIDMWVNGTTFVLNVPNTSAGQFYGFTSATPFTSVEFRAGSASGSQETYYSIDVALKPVPIPGAALLLGSGLAGLGVFGRRRKK